MALTPHSVLRTRLTAELRGVGGSARRAEVLELLEASYADVWTPEDRLPQNSRPFETKWRNRVSFERQRMVEAGLLEPRADGVWSLTPTAVALVEKVDLEKAAWRDREIARREALFSLLQPSGDGTVTAPDVRAVGLYSGARGIYVNVEQTKSRWTPEGVTVSLLALNEQYANEVDAGGMLYRFPNTERTGRDAAEIAATVRAYELAVPIFVIARAPGPSARTVRRAFVEDLDVRANTALITFADDGELPPAPPVSDATPFELQTDSEAYIWARRRTRPHQARFAFDVFRRYGVACAVCSLAVPDALEAAHLMPKAERGVDDARNGLALCRNHHRMLDRSLFAIEPTSLSVRTRPRTSLEGLGITHATLEHLPALPHSEALSFVWARWNG